MKLDPNQNYTFSKYFENGYYSEDLADYFGYKLVLVNLMLPLYQGELDRLAELRDRITEVLPYVPLTTELARREVIISKVVLELIHYTNVQIRIEFGIKVSNLLQGNLDYLIRTYQTNQLLVVEAKYEDLTRGFTQLVAEMIALDQWEESPAITEQPILIGSVTTGKIWQFARLDRANKYFELAINSYRVPEDLEELMRILLAVLKSE
ncbi:MAG: hypothetical protein RM368_19970 [Nostoc sp. DedSLP03]|uniref:hypothetical protein n=1 Tax=Nostoc sp. DedSLP03 TaxID=3075400 RepID=UPI002AD1E715|nr:hypothetical protein [Nostoc sp. DedSLP03]MDZ7967219.1 hypothetical protein [Nostoc sp. DedSLP03]